MLAALPAPLMAQRVKEPLSGLDLMVFQKPELRVVETPTDVEALRDRVPSMRPYDVFRAENGMIWKITLDERRGVPTLVDGGAIPFIPGAANSLSWDGFTAGYGGSDCPSKALVADDPEGAAGGFFWYLVTGSNTHGEGTPGNATGGQRTMRSSGACP
jgi:hypothetical protein